jgi:AraC family carnitine catabolism transcriptional activator
MSLPAAAISRSESCSTFLGNIKTSPKSCYLTFRLQRAKELLLYGDMSVRETRLASGFSSPASHFRAFRERFATSAMN